MSEVRNQISVFNPASGIEKASFSIYTNQDADVMARALAGLQSSLELLEGVSRLLASQQLRGRNIHLGELATARRLVLAYAGMVELVQVEGDRARGVK